MEGDGGGGRGRKGGREGGMLGGRKGEGGREGTVFTCRNRREGLRNGRKQGFNHNTLTMYRSEVYVVDL